VTEVKLHAFVLGQTTRPTIDAHDVYEAVLGDICHLEALGYDGAWLAEHHFSNYALVPNPLVLLAAAARETDRIGLGTAIIVLPLRNPLLVAEEAAMVDILSGGRLQLGLGRGYQPYEFRALGVDFDAAAARLSEGIDLLQHLWTRPDTPFSSSQYDVPALTVTPAPVQRPHPPLWMACGSAGSIGAALDKNCNVVVNVGNRGPGLVEQLRSVFDEQCERRGIDPVTRTFAAQTHGYLVEGQADEDVVVRSSGHLHRVQARLRRDGQGLVGGVNDASGREEGEPTFEGHSSASLMGSAEHMRRQAQRFADLGVTDLFVTYRFGEMQTPRVRESMQAVSEAIAAVTPRQPLTV
jgi:alkanesulfonate monooxygenase SsuD/methylene tetrahydromethanopterin reductase-like flavin-dependent oxidoreductase (luciferase family)